MDGTLVLFAPDEPDEPDDRDDQGPEPQALIFAFTCASDGFVSAEPSAKRTVGTVWLPLFTWATNVAAASSCSMSTSRNAMPSRSIIDLRRLQ